MLKWTLIDLFIDMSPAWLASGINLESSLLLLTSIWCTFQAYLHLQSVTVNSGRFLLPWCHDMSQADWPLESAQNRLRYC